MKIYRLEFAHNRNYGPFNAPPDMMSFIFGQPGDILPADAAQVAAKLAGVKGPYEMPAPADDRLDSMELREAQRNAEYNNQHLVFGFSSLDQYREWFKTPDVRRATFIHMTRLARTDTEEFNDMELRCFDIPTDKVFVGDHQVAFVLENATGSIQIPREQAIA